MKKILLSLIFTFLLPLTAFAELASASDGMSLFVGDGCRSCEEILQYAEANNLQTAFTLKIYEIYNDDTNRSIYESKRAKVGANDALPLLVIDETDSISGYQNIVDYFESFKTQTDSEKSNLTQKDSQNLNEILSTTPVIPAEQAETDSYLIKLLVVILIAVFISILIRRKK